MVASKHRMARVGFSDLRGTEAVVVSEPITLEQRFALVRYLVIEVLERRGAAPVTTHDVGDTIGWFGPWSVTVSLAKNGMGAILEVMDQLDASAADRLVAGLPPAREALGEINEILELFRPRVAQGKVLERYGSVEVLGDGKAMVTPGSVAAASARVVVEQGIVQRLEVRSAAGWVPVELERIHDLASQATAIAGLVRELGGLPPAGVRDVLPGSRRRHARELGVGVGVVEAEAAAS